MSSSTTHLNLSPLFVNLPSPTFFPTQSFSPVASPPSPSSPILSSPISPPTSPTFFSSTTSQTQPSPPPSVPSSPLLASHITNSPPPSPRLPHSHHHRKKIYTYTNQLPKPPHLRIGKKNRLLNNDDAFTDLYLHLCCSKHHMVLNFSLGFFTARRKEYLLLVTEKQKSIFIDRLLDSSIRPESDNTATYVARSTFFCLFIHFVTDLILL